MELGWSPSNTPRSPRPDQGLFSPNSEFGVAVGPSSRDPRFSPRQGKGFDSLSSSPTSTPRGLRPMYSTEL